MIELFKNYNDWKKVKEVVILENLFQKNTKSSIKTIYREIESRMKLLPEKMAKNMVNLPMIDQSHLLFYASCRYYKFIYDFMVEVMYPKYKSLDCQLWESDFFRFFDVKKETHPELKVTITTTKKIKQVMFRMLNEAGILDSIKSLKLQKPVLSKKVKDFISKEDSKYLKIFLI